MSDRMNTKWLAAAFFMVRDGRPARPLHEWATLAGMVIDGEHTTNPFLHSRWQLAHGKWDGLDSAWAKLDTLEFHYWLQIYFLQSSFFALRPVESPVLEEDGAYPLALTFRSACERLQPEVAFIVTYASGASHEAVMDLYPDVLGMSGVALGRQPLGLLYLDARVAQEWLPDPDFNDRDSLPVAEGRLVFGGRGWRRW